jgi:hypothetical protein
MLHPYVDITPCAHIPRARLELASSGREPEMIATTLPGRTAGTET